MRRLSASGSAWAALVALAGGYLFVDLIAAAPASPLVPPLLPDARPAGWMARWTSALGLDRLGRAGLTALALVLMALLLGAFGLLLYETWRGRVGVGSVAIGGTFAIALAVWAPVLLSRDVYSYAAYGRIAAVGANPYLVPPSAFPHDPFTPITSTAWRDTRSLYGPLFTLVSEGVVRAAPEPGRTVLGFKVLAGVALALAAGFAAAAAGASGRAPPAFAAAAVALNPVLVVHMVGGGHNDGLVAAGLGGAAYLVVRGDRAARRAGSPAAFAVTAVLALVASIKVPSAVALAVWLGWLAWRRREPVPVLAGHVAVALGVVAATAAPYFAGRRTPSALATLAGVQGWASPARLLARGAQAIGDVIGPSVGDGAVKAVVAAFLVLFAWMLVRLVRADADPIPAMWGIALLLFALTAPYLLPWYAAWFMPLLPLASDRRLLLVGLVAGGVLALTGIPAEPASAPGVWRGMILAVHYVAAPAMLALLVVAVRRVVGLPPTRDTATSGSKGLMDART